MFVVEKLNNYALPQRIVDMYCQIL